MPSLNIDVGENGIEISTCMAHGCVEYSETGKWIDFRYNEQIDKDDVNAQIIKEFKLMKRQNYKEYVDKFIEGFSVRIDENKLDEAVKDIYGVYKSFMEEYSKGRKYIGMKIRGLGFKGIDTIFRMRYQETGGLYRVIIQLDVHKDGEWLTYYFDAGIKDPYTEVPKEFRRVAGLFMLFAEYINKPPLEQVQEKA